jgi:hypothetical protein
MARFGLGKAVSGERAAVFVCNSARLEVIYWGLVAWVSDGLVAVGVFGAPVQKKTWGVKRQKVGHVCCRQSGEVVWQWGVVFFRAIKTRLGLLALGDIAFSGSRFMSKGRRTMARSLHWAA